MGNLRKEETFLVLRDGKPLYSYGEESEAVNFCNVVREYEAEHVKPHKRQEYSIQKVPLYRKKVT